MNNETAELFSPSGQVLREPEQSDSGENRAQIEISLVLAMLENRTGRTVEHLKMLDRDDAHPERRVKITLASVPPWS